MVSTRSGHNYFPKPFRQQPLASATARRVEETRYEVSRIKRKGQRRARARRLHQAILGPNPTFSGRVTISAHSEAREPDSIRLHHDDDDIALGNTLIYWADGSYAHKGACAGFMGAGVSWLEGKDYLCATYELGRYTGNSEDAEVFAIAAALAKAQNEVWESMEILTVKVYSDAMGVLEAIRQGTPCRIGPMLNDPKPALQAIYERAKWLTAKGVEVELIWVKGHSKSKGNQMADEAASLAVSDQGDSVLTNAWQWNSNYSRTKTTEDVPEPWKHMGSDWVDEWVSRANVQNTEDRMAYPSFMGTIFDHDQPLLEGLTYSAGGLPYDDESLPHNNGSLRYDENLSRGLPQCNRAAAQADRYQLLSSTIHHSARDELHVQEAEMPIQHVFPVSDSLPEDQQEPDEELFDDEPSGDNQLREDRLDNDPSDDTQPQDDLPEDNEPEDDEPEEDLRTDSRETEHEHSPALDHFAFSIPDLRQYGNITVEQAIGDLRVKLNFTDAHIAHLEERVVDLHGRWQTGVIRNALLKLDEQREQILLSIRGYKAALTVEQAFKKLRVQLDSVNAQISKLEAGYIDKHGRVHFGFVTLKPRKLDRQRERILSSIRAFEEDHARGGNGKTKKTPPMREASSMSAARSMASVHQTKDESEDVDMCTPDAEPNPLVAAGSNFSAHQSREEHNEVDTSMPDEDTRSSFASRTMSKPQGPPTLNVGSTLLLNQPQERSEDVNTSGSDGETKSSLVADAMSKLHLSSTPKHATFLEPRETCDWKEKNVLMDNDNPFLAGCALFSSRRSDEEPSSQQCDSESDEEGTQYELDMQIENDILFAQRYATCKL